MSGENDNQLACRVLDPFIERLAGEILAGKLHDLNIKLPSTVESSVPAAIINNDDLEVFEALTKDTLEAWSDPTLLVVGTND